MRKIQLVAKREEPPRRSNNSSARNAPNVKYRECRKNQALSIGGYAVDGCREFMANGAEGTPGALTCAACGCHRNFHRKVVQNVEYNSSSPSTSGA